jgi:DNA-binding PadR family transcriptional regulator
MLDLAILGLLYDEKRHGYELRRQLAEYGFWSVSFGSLYPALRRLEKQGLIEAAGHSGRRKSYRITSDGDERFRELLEDQGADEDDRAFNLRLAFFSYLDSDSRLGVLERRRAQLVERLAEANATLKRKGAAARRRMDRYTVSLMEHGVRSAEADIEWLDELIETERAETPRQARRTRSARRRAGGAGQPVPNE